MSIINDYLDYISTANYGSDVREAIVSSIRECYKDATGHPDSVAALVQEYIDREESIDDKVSLLTGLYNSLGEIVYSYDYTNFETEIHIASGEFECVDQITLEPGKWIIQVGSSFFKVTDAAPNKATFYLSLSNTLNSAGYPTPISGDYRLDEYAGTILNSSVTNFHFIRMISLIEETTIYMWIKHPGDISNDYVVNPRMIAMKIGESTPSEGTSIADQVVANTEDISILEGKVATNISNISTLTSDVRADLDMLYPSALVKKIVFTRGGVSSNSGGINESQDRLHSTLIFVRKGDVIDVPNSSIKYWIAHYKVVSGTFTFVGATPSNGGYLKGKTAITEDGLACVILVKEDGTDFNSSQCEAINGTVYLYSTTAKKYYGLYFDVGQIQSNSESYYWAFEGNDYFIIDTSTSVNLNITRWKTAEIALFKAGTTVEIANGYRFYTYVYDASGNVTQQIPWNTATYTFATDTYARLVIDRTVGSTLPYNQWDELDSVVNIITPTEQLLEDVEDALVQTTTLDKNDADYNYRVYTSSTIDSETGTRIRMVYKLDYPAHLTALCSAGKGLAVNLYSTLDEALYAGSNYIATYSNGGYVKTEIDATVGTGYLSISQSKEDGSSITDTERTSLFNALSLSLTLNIPRLQKMQDEIDSLMNGTEADTIRLNSDMNDALVAMCGYNAFASGNWESASGKKNNLSFSLITDIHGSADSLKRFVNYCNEKSNYLDFCLGMGDFVARQPSESVDYMNKAINDLQIPFFYTVGNHDSADTDLSGITQATARTKYFSKIESKGWLESSDFMGTGKCSWHKDFASHKIRIISLFEYGNADTISSGAPSSYCRRWIDSDLLQWFADTLYTTPNGYSVIVLLHQIPYAPMTFVENPFTVTEDIAFIASNWDASFLNTIDGNPIEEIVNAFKNSLSINKSYNSIASYGLGKTASVSKDFSSRPENGEFIAYFAGHTHASYVFRSQTFTDQMCIVAPTGSENIFQRQYGDMLYDSDTRNKDSFYCVGINTDLKKINLIQIGGQTTLDMRERILTAIDY